MKSLVRRWIAFAIVLIAPAVYALEDGLYAVLHTSEGSITARLHYAESPMTVANFVGLAEGSQAWMDDETGAVGPAPFYDETIFHRVIEGFMIQGGTRDGRGASGPGYRFPDEIPNGLKHDGPGILSMANSGLDSNGSQFFITVTATLWLDGAHTVFGRVINGQDVVDTISSVPVDDRDRPVEDVVLETIDILRIGTDAEQFDTAGLLPSVKEGRIWDMTMTAEGPRGYFKPSAFHAYHLRSSPDLMTWSVSKLITYADEAPETEPIYLGAEPTNQAFYALVTQEYPGNAYPLVSMNNRSVEFTFHEPPEMAGTRIRYNFGESNSVLLNGESAGAISAASYEYLLYPNRSTLLVVGTHIVRIDYRLNFESPTNGTFSAIAYAQPPENRATGVFVLDH